MINKEAEKSSASLFWVQSVLPLLLPSIPRSRAAVARRAHNPKVGSSILPFATDKAL